MHIRPLSEWRLSVRGQEYRHRGTPYLRLIALRVRVGQVRC